jgi:hypothetical protein
MKLVSDHTTFDALQRHLLGELVASIRDCLRDAGVEGSQLYEATASVSATVAAIIDGSREMYLDDHEVIPVLSFARDRDGGDLIISDGTGSSMHDYVQVVVDEHVSADDDDGEFDESIDFGMDDK